MPRKTDTIAINDHFIDKRTKLLPCQKERVVAMYGTGNYSQRDLAKMFKVSKRLIQFTLDPEKLKRAKAQFAERQKGGKYYDKDKHTENVKFLDQKT
jgi:transposase